MQNDTINQTQDPNLHWDGQQWLRWDGQQWLPAASVVATKKKMGKGAKVAIGCGAGLSGLFAVLVGAAAVSPQPKDQSTPSSSTQQQAAAPTVTVQQSCQKVADAIIMTPQAAGLAAARQAQAQAPAAIEPQIAALAAVWPMDDSGSNYTIDSLNAIVAFSDVCVAHGFKPTLAP